MRPSLVLALIGFMAVTAAEDAPILVEKPWIRRAAILPGAPSSTAGYVTLRNRGPARDALISAAADVAKRVELHETRNMSGMMMMEKVAKIELAPGARVELRPGSFHLMLIGLTHALTPGQIVTLALEFERAGRIAVRAEVR